MSIPAKQGGPRRAIFAGSVLATAVIAIGVTPRPAAAQYVFHYGYPAAGYYSYAYPPYTYYPSYTYPSYSYPYYVYPYYGRGGWGSGRGGWEGGGADTARITAGGTMAAGTRRMMSTSRPMRRPGLPFIDSAPTPVRPLGEFLCYEGGRGDR